MEAGYSKIKLEKRTKSRSIDISDLFPFPQTLKATENMMSPNDTPKTQETKQIHITKTNDSTPEAVDENGNRELFDMKLSKSCSLSSSHIFRFDRQSTTKLESAVKRVFSMRRSSSVSERYCRIHDQCVTLASPWNDDVDGNGNDNPTTQAKFMKKKKKKKSSSGRVLKACKRFFGI